MARALLWVRGGGRESCVVAPMGRGCCCGGLSCRSMKAAALGLFLCPLLRPIPEASARQVSILLQCISSDFLPHGALCVGVSTGFLRRTADTFDEGPGPHGAMGSTLGNGHHQEMGSRSFQEESGNI